MGYYQPQNYTYGGGGPTQNMVGMGANLVGNAIFPGLGFLTGPIGRFVTQMIQQGGGVQDPMNPGQSSVGGVPSPATGGFFARGPAIHYSQGGVPAPGGSSGIYGQGSGGDMGNAWARIAMRAYNQGNPAMGLDAPGSAVPMYAASLKGASTAAPAWATIAPYFQSNAPKVVGEVSKFGATGKQMSAV